ncbi:hypothetical protein SynWH8101_1815 [Synechococcus sp. WH 8101]|nr:hypothetical protein SynWH8101_1815 [Synechococcus sp. WH 8101]QNI45645.1 putative bacteriocin-lantipeptide leader / core peptide/ Class II [Synechococcus sp. WH 8101]
MSCQIRATQLRSQHNLNSLKSNPFFARYLDADFVRQRIQVFEVGMVSFYSVWLYLPSLAYNCVMK